MTFFAYARDANIKRFENLLATTLDAFERLTIETLLSEEKAKARVAGIGSEVARR
jgi:hypothetical protein